VYFGNGHKIGPGIDSTWRIAHGVLECSIPVAEEHAHASRIRVRYYQIRCAIAIHVANRDRRGPHSAGVVDYRRLKRAVAVAEEHAHSPGTAASATTDCARVRHQQIGNAIAIHVSDRHEVRAVGTRTEGNSRLEGAVPVAEQQTYHAEASSATTTGYDQIGIAVTIQVRDRDGLGRSRA